MGRRRPGALRAAFLWRACERNGHGIVDTVEEAEKVPLSMSLSAKSNVKDLRNLSEAQTCLEALGFLIKGDQRRAADMLRMRYLAIERSVADKNDWKVAQQYELRRNVSARIGSASL